MNAFFSHPVRTAHHRTCTLPPSRCETVAAHPAATGVAEPAAAELCHFVKSYERFCDTSALVRRWLMPSSITIALTFGPCRLIAPRQAAQPKLSPFVHGLSGAASRVEHSAGTAGIWIDLTPLGAAALFAVPGIALRDKITPLSDLLGRDADRLASEALAADDWAESRAILDRYLLERIAEKGAKIPPEVVLAWHHITVSGGQIPIADITDELRCSRRHLAQRFNEVFGITPKAFGRIVRFERAFDNLLAGNDSLSAIALDCGYYDQAHFNRDMRAIIGTCPSAFLSARLIRGIDLEYAGVRAC